MNATAADPALLHRPTDPALLKLEAEKLLALGLSVRDVAAALDAAPAQVAGWLAGMAVRPHG